MNMKWIYLTIWYKAISITISNDKINMDSQANDGVKEKVCEISKEDPGISNKF